MFKMLKSGCLNVKTLLITLYIYLILPGVERGQEPPCIKYVLSPGFHKQGGAVQTDLSAKAPQGARPLGTLSAWGAASQSARLLVTFGLKSDVRSTKD